MDNIIHAINDNLSRNQCDKSEPSTSLDEISFVKSCFVDIPKEDFELPDDDVPPDKAILRSLYHVKICTLELRRSLTEIATVTLKRIMSARKWHGRQIRMVFGILLRKRSEI